MGTAERQPALPDVTATVGNNQVYHVRYFMSGDIAEILFYSSALPELEQRTVDTYLRTQYALP
ncbi:uncharacterized protein STAUR_7437 [Stigmatella aurantiaca DW4/3-1]|uniref:Uncharacterized protein n=1 Tax=Stigmatella aurantiaca (strain DW4/3-1) TaxID=378806 RepID=E3FFT4_STIAD|nr:uncharacterized protein STAUR_7437 [Stigmatella aurantiaca DW4/3-1]